MSSMLHLHEIMNRDRKNNTVLFGDVLFSEGQEFTVINNSGLGVFGILNGPDQEQTKLASFSDLKSLYDQGFELDPEHVAMDSEIQEMGLYAPRKLADGSWAALTSLLTTTAICVDFDYISMYESRYCFGHTQKMPSLMLAAFWLSKFKNKESLPIGNVAYRGHLGLEPIADPEITRTYYEKMFALKHEPFIEGLDMRGHANKIMNEYLLPIITTPTREITYEK